MDAIRVGIGQIGIGTFDPHGEIGTDEKVKDAVNAIGCDPLAARLGNRFGYVIGRGRLVETCQDIEDTRTHVGPLLTGFQKRHPRRFGKRRALMEPMVMCVAGHGLNLGARERRCKVQIKVQECALRFRSCPRATIMTPRIE